MVSATDTAHAPQAPQTAKSSRRPNRANKLDKADRDLASSGGAVPDQGHSKQQPPAEVKANSTPAGKSLSFGSVDAASAPADVSTSPRASTPTAFPPAADKQENPKRWHNVLGPLSQASGSSMAPGRRPQQQQQEPLQQAAGQAQDKAQSSRPPQAAAEPASSGKHASAGSSVPPPSSASDRTAAQQGVQYQGKPLRVARTASNSSNEAGTPVQGSQRGASGKQLQQQQAEGSTTATSSSSTGPKSAPLSYAAAAIHRQPQPAPAPTPAPAPARVKKPAPAPAAAVVQEPFPPLAATSKPSADGWGAGPGNPLAASGWGSSSASSSKTWGPKHAEAQANGKADVATSQAAQGTSTAEAMSSVPPTQSKPADASGVSKDGRTAHKQASSTAGTGSGVPPAAAGPSRQDSYGSQHASSRAGDGSSRRGGYGGDYPRGRRSSSNNGSQWAPKQPQSDAGVGVTMQQPSDPWARNAAAYTGEVAGKQTAYKLPATPTQLTEGQPAQQGSKGSSSNSGGKEAAVPKGSSAPMQPNSMGEPARKAADKGPHPAAAPAHSSSSKTGKTPEVASSTTVPALQDAGVTAASAAAAQQAAAAAVKTKAGPMASAAIPAAVKTLAAAGAVASAAQASIATKQHGATVTAANAAQPAPGSQQQAPHAGSHVISGTAATANVFGSQFGPSDGAFGSAVASPPQGSSLPPKADVLLAGKATKQLQQQHSPAVKLPSSQAVNMAAVAAHSNGSDDRFGAHSYGGVDSFAVSAAYPAVGGPSYQPSMQATSGLGNFMPLYQQPASTKLQSAVGPVDFLLSSTNTNSAFREATFVPPDAAVVPQAYSSMPGPQAPAGPSLHTAAGGPSSTGSRNGGSAAARGAAVTIKRNLSADAPPFEAPACTSSGGGNTGSGSAGSGSGSSSTEGAGGSGRAATGATQRGGSKAASRAAASGSGGSSQGRLSRQLFELAEQMQQDEQAREAEHAEAARKQADLHGRLQTEKAARLAAEARVSSLEQELDASHQRNKDLEQQLTLEFNMVARLEADLEAKAGEVEGASSRAAYAEAELNGTKQQLEDAQARNHRLQQQCQALEAEKLQLEHRISTQGAHAARVVADAAVAAAAAAIPGASGQHLHSSTMLHGIGLVGAQAPGGIAARVPPPGFDPVPVHSQHGGQQLPAPGSPGAASGSTAGGPQGDMVLRGQAGAGLPEKNEHQLVLTFLGCLPDDPNLALRFTDAEAVTVNVQLMPLTWDENYAPMYGSMQSFMTDRPMVFGVREDGAFYKYSNSEQLVQQKMAQEAEQAAAAAAAAPAPVASGPQPPASDSSNQGGSFAPQPQQQMPSGGAWQFHPQQQQLPAPQGPGQHSMHSGPPSGPGLNIHAMSMSMPMGPPAGMGLAGMHHPHGPVPPHMGASMGLATMGMPYYPPYNMMHSMPASMPLAGPSMPFPSGPRREQGW